MRQRTIDISSNDNTLFCTEQCNNRCIMCCQPPSKKNDIDKLFDTNIKRIKSAPKELEIIGLTGGEPTLLGDRLIELITVIRQELPNTDIHLLTNGRKLADYSYAKKIVEAGEGYLIFGIPLHSDYYKDHDIIAGVNGAYDETITGLYNLASLGAFIELRVVMNRLNHNRFFPIAEFVHKNLSFVSCIAYMGMEYTGFAIKQSERIWIEPQEYSSELAKAVSYLADWKYNVCIYNIPHCLLPESVYEYAKKSISDWKNYYLEICNNCSAKDKCCGFFSTSIKPYAGIKTL